MKRLGDNTTNTSTVYQSVFMQLKDFFLDWDNNKQQKVSLFILFSLAIVLPLIWIPNGYLYKTEEYLFVDYEKYLRQALYLWNESINYGQVAGVEDAAAIPNGFIYGLLHRIGVSPHFRQVIFLQLILTSVFLSMYYFLLIIADNRKAIFAGTIFYVFNFYFMACIGYSAKMGQMILLPLLFTWMYRFLEQKNGRYIAYNLMTIFLSHVMVANLPQLAATFIVYPVTIGYFIFEKRLNVKVFLQQYASQLMVFFFSMIPFFLYQGVHLWFYFSEIFEEVKQFTTFKALVAPLDLIFQFRGSWWEYEGYRGIAYNIWHHFYDSYTVVISSFFLLFTSLSIFFVNHSRRKKIFFLMVFLVGLGFSSGWYFFPKFYQWLMQTVPFFYIFREPWAKFMPWVLLPLSALFTLSLSYFSNRFFFLIVMSLLIVKGANFFSSDFLDLSNKDWKRTFIRFPDYWRQYENWSTHHKAQYILPLPFLLDPMEFVYNWYPEDIGNSNDPVYKLIGSTNIVGLSGNISHFNKSLKSFVEQQNVDFVLQSPIDYLLVDKDDMRLGSADALQNIAWQSNVRKYFNNTPDVVFGKKIFLYKIKPEYHFPLFYQVEIANIKTIPLFTKLTNIDHLAVNWHIPKEGAANSIFDINYLSETDNPWKITACEKIHYKALNYVKINPTKFLIEIKAVKNSFILNFSENFQPGWFLYVKKGFFHLNLNHIMVNKYANGWIVEPRKLCFEKPESCIKNFDGSYDFQLILEFWPEHLYFWSFLLSCFVFIMCLLYMLIQVIINPINK